MIFDKVCYEKMKKTLLELGYKIIDIAEIEKYDLVFPKSADEYTVKIIQIVYSFFVLSCKGSGKDPIKTSFSQQVAPFMLYFSIVELGLGKKFTNEFLHVYSKKYPRFNELIKKQEFKNYNSYRK